MSNLFRPRQSFLQNNAWQNQALNALHYNTAQQGSVVPLIYGTVRQQVNIIDLNGYRGPKGKKGKSGSLPISGTHQSGKGGGGGKGKGGKKNAHYSVDVDFAICQGPVAFISSNMIFSSSGVEQFSASGLHFYIGSDGQAPDGHFNQVGYSGTCHVTGTPLDLGQSPVLPNIALEISGILAGYHSGSYSKDANPGDVITDFLTNVRYGCGWPVECLTRLAHDETGAVLNTYGDYCQAAGLLISVSLDGHQKAIEWLSGIVTLTNSALVWSGRYIKIIPYGDLALNFNGATWEPDLTNQYDLTDDDLLPWSPHQEGNVPNPGDDDPIMLTRSNPADADNWVSIEYSDRLNFYNSTTLTAFDQGAIDTYGLRIGDSLPGRAFTGATPAQVSLQLILQRRLYIRNSQIKFQLGWQFALLEPMDMVSLTGRVGDNYLQQYPVRIVSIEENDNGDLTISAEDPQAGISAPVMTPVLPEAVLHGPDYWNPLSGHWYLWLSSSTFDTSDPDYDSVYEWRSTHPPDGPKGTFSVWMEHNSTHIPFDGEIMGFFQTNTVYTIGEHWRILAAVDFTGAFFVIMNNQRKFQTPPDTVKFDGSWHHLLMTWDLPHRIRFWYDGQELTDTNIYDNVIDRPLPTFIQYSTEGNVSVFSVQSGLHLLGNWFRGCSNDFWLDFENNVDNPGAFRNLNGTPKDLGFRGENPMGSPPKIYLHYPTGLGGTTYPGAPSSWGGPYLPGESGYYGINRAGYKCDDSAYWIALNNPSGVTTGPGANASDCCDPEHPNLFTTSVQPTICAEPYLPSS